ncbi:MAG: ferrochelatase [Gammaproteobacteria bacterium]|nr:ferrochelatase [Gammaproteobacteria bacterium]
MGDEDRGGTGTTGVLLSNLGTPDQPTPPAVRRYLREFLSDPRVVSLPRWLWLPLLNGVILQVRPRRSARLYEGVWTPEGSPLLVTARRQLQALRARFAGDKRLVFALGMRYGSPSIAGALEELRAAGAEHLLVVPLYPQYSSATTASTFDAVARALKGWIRVPELRVVADYHAEPWYIRALADSIRDAWRQQPAGERLLFSFHGMPRRTQQAGDPYHDQCQRTARLVAAELGLAADRWLVAFQSRFGYEEWLQPYTDQTLRAWGGSHVASVDVVCPGFSADCLETLEEIAVMNRDLYVEASGGRFRYIPALNERPDHIEGLAELIRSQIQGW